MGFVKNNIVLIVMLPVIGAIHYGWWQMSDNKDRKELPIVSVSPIPNFSNTPLIASGSPTDVPDARQ